MVTTALAGENGDNSARWREEMNGTGRLQPFPCPLLSCKNIPAPWAALGGWQGGGAAAPCALLPAPRLPPLVRIMTLGALQGFSFVLVKSN